MRRRPLRFEPLLNRKEDEKGLFQGASQALEGISSVISRIDTHRTKECSITRLRSVITAASNELIYQQFQMDRSSPPDLLRTAVVRQRY